jgi:hypothetical protein
MPPEFNSGWMNPQGVKHMKKINQMLVIGLTGTIIAAMLLQGTPSMAAPTVAKSTLSFSGNLNDEDDLDGEVGVAFLPDTAGDLFPGPEGEAVLPDIGEPQGQYILPDTTIGDTFPGPGEIYITVAANPDASGN